MEERGKRSRGGVVTTGDEYIATMSARVSDRRARTAFCDLAMQTVAPGAVIFDFGAGPGIDAKLYAEHGYHVFAYDVDSQMCETFLMHCRRQIELQHVALYEGSYQNFLDSVASFTDSAAIDLITANFAPLSLVDDPHALFALFHTITKNNGKILLSVLNPYYLGDMRYVWWWRNLITFVRRGHYVVPGGTWNIHRRSAKNFSTASAPYFVLKAATRGMPGNIPRRGLLRIPFLATSRFMFLLFEKRR
jgi:SAM-dependent methyltransferase